MSVAPTDQSKGTVPLTLGELLYADPAITRIPEKDWLALVRAMAGGAETALQVLFEKASPIVSTYLMRLTGDRRVTEEIILEVFEDLWCEAPLFNEANGPVLGWIMRQARASALAHAVETESAPRGAGRIVSKLLQSSEIANVRLYDGRHVEAALATLTVDERGAIEAALLDGLSYAEAAANCGESSATIKHRVRSGLLKLRRSLHEGGES